MAKSISIAEALAVLAANDIQWTEEQEAAIAELKSAAFLGTAVEVFDGNGDNLPGKLVEDSESDGEVWATDMFALSERMVSDIVSDVKNVQGGAVRTVRMFGIETPNGHLKVELRSE